MENKNTMTTEQGNKLIAEFMGGVYERRVGSISKSPYETWTFVGLPDRVEKDETRYVYQASELLYDKWWDWLMPVVEKIAIDYDVRISWFDKNCVATISNTSLEGSEIADFGNFTPAIINVWKAVVEFIQWYNSQKVMDGGRLQ